MITLSNFTIWNSSCFNRPYFIYVNERAVETEKILQDRVLFSEYAGPLKWLVNLFIIELWQLEDVLRFWYNMHLPLKLNLEKQTETETRMVQLPDTAAIEYVAACCRTRTWTRTKTGTKTKIGTITITVRGAYARSPKFNAYTNRLGFLCLAS